MPLPHLVDVLARGAIGNARAAAEAVAQQVADRRRLAPTETPQGPGSLSRLSRAECLELLASRRVARLAYIARVGVPDVVPVNYALHDGDLLVRSGVGPKLQAAERGEVLVLEVDDLDEDAHTGWSVVAAGSGKRLTSREVHALPEGVLPDTWAVGPRFAVLRVRLTRIEGRRLS